MAATWPATLTILSMTRWRRREIIPSLRANGRREACPMTGSAKPSRTASAEIVWIASSLSLLAMTTQEEQMAKPAAAAGIASGQCLCGKVAFEIDVPARWAWHDHSASSRRAHGAAYATYVGSWRKRFRIVKGKTAIARYEDKDKTARSFCARCGTPLFYERRALAAHGEHPARAVLGPHRPPAALSHRHRGAAGMGLYRRAAGAAEGLSRRGLAAQEETPCRASVLGTDVLIPSIDAFSSREPLRTSLENAMLRRPLRARPRRCLSDANDLRSVGAPVFVVAHPSRRGLTAAPQDEVVTSGTKLDPHGEERGNATRFEP